MKADTYKFHYTTRHLSSLQSFRVYCSSNDFGYTYDVFSLIITDVVLREISAQL